MSEYCRGLIYAIPKLEHCEKLVQLVYKHHLQGMFLENAIAFSMIPANFRPRRPDADVPAWLCAERD